MQQSAAAAIQWNETFVGNSNNKSKTIEQLNNLTNLTLILIYPPTADPSTHTFINTLILISSLTLGICGNASQIALQWYTKRLRLFRSHRTSNCSQLYICLLHVVYFAISISLPSVIIDNLVKIWMFGMFTCRTHFVFVTLGRTIAAWTITLLFIDQYALLLEWKKTANRTQAFFICSSILIASISGVVLIPSLLFVKITEVILHEERSSPTTLLRIRTFTCSTHLPVQLSLYLNLLNMTLDFLIPLLIVLLIGHKIALFNNSSTQIGTRKTISIPLVILAVMHFVSYLPHWLAVLIRLINERWRLELAASTMQIILADAVLLLPQLMASFAWIPASCLSRQLLSTANINNNNNININININNNQHNNSNAPSTKIIKSKSGTVHRKDHLLLSI